MEELNSECIALMRGPDASGFADFPNGTRTDPIEQRFRGQGKLEKLRMLKKKWDARGVVPPSAPGLIPRPWLCLIVLGKRYSFVRLQVESI